MSNTRRRSGRSSRGHVQFRGRSRPAVRGSAVEALEERRLLATFAVTTTTDGGAGSLRQAILDANAAAGADTITLPAGTYTLTVAGAGEDLAATGDLDVTDALTINGAGAASTIIQAGTTTANGIDRVFDIRNLVPATFTDMTIRHGRVVGEGGGIRNTGALTLDAVLLERNHAVSDAVFDGEGGGLFTEGTANDSVSGTTTIRDSSVNDNVADDDGGGIYHVPADGDLVIEGSDVNRNEATNGDAGGVYHVPGRGDLIITDSTIDENTAAGDAGGIYSVALAGNFSLSGSFVTDNDSSEGGGIYHVPSTGDLTIAGTTISGNTSTGDAGGIYFVPRTGDLTITGTNVSGNASAGDAGGIYVVPATGNLSITDGAIADNDAGGVGGGLYLASAGTASITGTTIRDNEAGGEGGGINTDTGALSLTNATVSGNTSDSGDGGGIEAEDDLTIDNSVIHSNRAFGGDGGGINLNDDAELRLTDSTVRDNTASGRGGGIRSSSDLTITASTISGNDAADGGGLWIKRSVATLTNVTVSGNSASSDGGSGGGIFMRETDVDMTLINVTVTDNAAAFGGGIFNQPDEQSPLTPALTNTVVAGNRLEVETGITGEGTDLHGAFSASNSLIGIGDGSTGVTDGDNGNQVGTAADPIDPLLGPLADNGGPTLTHALLPGSPALDVADLDTAPEFDQRGVTRPQGPAPDAGAFEREVDDEPPVAPTLSINDVSKDEGDSGLTPFTFTITRTGDLSAPSSVNWATEFGNAVTTSADLDPQSGVASFAANASTATVTVFVKGDTQVEQDNLFFVNLSSASGATIDDGQGRGDIRNDDEGQPPPQVKGSISGHVFDDRNVNQLREGNEPVLGGFTVYIDRNRNGRRDGGEPSTTSNNAGEYRFSNLDAGTYVVRIVLKSGWRQTKPPGNGGHTVNLGSGQNATDRGFGLTRRAAISGTVYRDANRNGRLDSSELGLSGRTVFIDANGNAKLDAGELSAVTDSKGQYTLKSVPSGSIRLRLVLAGSPPTVGSDGVYHLNVSDGQIVTNKHFGLR